MLARLCLQGLERHARLQIAQRLGQRGQLLQRRARIARVIALARATGLVGILLKPGTGRSGDAALSGNAPEGAMG